eukprot:TRINITY_DN45594_c0_g1_i1.p1 TRINITY_DN45594_c0_g1~~TRINITY_DN45594_c0_g1_i1.p1  ORF type:complete len:288 (+),score=67.82 TRINITY_DN45594_c0_g1_i1:46-909(+)
MAAHQSSSWLLACYALAVALLPTLASAAEKEQRDQQDWLQHHQQQLSLLQRRQQHRQRHQRSDLQRKAVAGHFRGTKASPLVERRWKVTFPEVPWRLPDPPPTGFPGLLGGFVVPEGYDVAGDGTDAYITQLQESFKDNILHSLRPCNVTIVDEAVPATNRSTGDTIERSAPSRKPGDHGVVGTVIEASNAAEIAAKVAQDSALAAGKVIDASAQASERAAMLAKQTALDAAEAWSRRALFGFEGDPDARVQVLPSSDAWQMPQVIEGEHSRAVPTMDDMIPGTVVP